MNTLTFFALAATLMLASNLAMADDIYMCEIVNGESAQIVATTDADLVFAPGYRLVTHSDEVTHTLDVKIYKDVHLKFDAQIEEGPDARPILLPLGSVTLDCKNQNPDALTWSLRALKFAQKAHDGLGEKVEGDVVGLKTGIGASAAPDSTQVFAQPIVQKMPAN